jgi:hypothetical protein
MRTIKTAVTNQKDVTAMEVLLPGPVCFTTLRNDIASNNAGSGFDNLGVVLDGSPNNMQEIPST